MREHILSFWPFAKQRFIRWAYLYVQAQLVATLCSLPILVAWGIECSIMALVGNLLFSPLITLFLLLCSLMFFAELCTLPTTYLAKLLSILTDLITSILGLGTKYWLCCFAKPPLWCLMLIPLGMLCILANPRIKTHRKRTVGLAFILAVSLSGLTLFSYARQHTITISKLTITKNPQTGQLKLWDHGHFGRKASMRSYVNFSLKPYLIKQFGTTVIEQLSMPTVSRRNLAAVQELVRSCRVQRVLLGTPRKQIIPKADNDSTLDTTYVDLCTLLAQEGVECVSLPHKIHRRYRNSQKEKLPT